MSSDHHRQNRKAMTWIQRKLDDRRAAEDAQRGKQEARMQEARLIAERAKYFWQALLDDLRLTLQQYREATPGAVVIETPRPGQAVFIEKTTHPSASVEITLNTGALTLEF